MEKSLNEMNAGELRELLLERQIRFAEALAGGADPKEAAIKAGYSEKSAAVQGARLIKNEKISAYRRAICAQSEPEETISPEWVRHRLAEVAKRCMEPKPHMVWDKSGQCYVHDGTWDFDADGAIKALSAIGKLDVMSGESGEKTGREGVEAFLEQLDGGRIF